MDLLMLLIWIVVGGFVLIQGTTMLLRFINNGGFKRARTKAKSENVKPIKGSPFSVEGIFDGQPGLIRINNGIIEKHRKISANKDLATYFRNDLYGLMDVHKRLADQWRENVGTPGYEMVSVSAEILTKISVKLDEIINYMYKESVEKLNIENKVLDHMK